MGTRTIGRVLHLGSTVALLVAASRLATDGGEAGGSWPQFHGPNRDNISTETGLLKQWPEGGPRLIWTHSECGRGLAGVSIADGMIFTVGDFGKKEAVLALDLDGKPVWKAENGKSWLGPHPGARTTPTCDEGLLYHMNPTGRLAAFEAKTGKERWSVDLKDQFGVKFGQWAMAENIVIEGKVLFCAPGGRKGRIVALDKTTGATLWANTEIAEGVAYCTPLFVTHHGARQMITVMAKTLVAVDVRTGKLLWTHKHETKHDQNVTMPIFKDGRVFASSGHGTGGRLLEISPSGDRVAERWLNKDLDNCHGGVILLGRHLYGSGCRLFRKGLVCVDFAAGQTVWNNKGLGKVSITYADGRLYCLSDRGKMSLADVSPERCRVVSQFRIPKPRKWSNDLSLSHPVVCGGRLYVRYGSDLFAYDIRAAGAGGPRTP